MYFLYIFFLSLLSCSVVSQDPVVNLSQGRVVGIKVFTENALKPIEVFFGIPYAAPPTGRLRFSPPERHIGWRRTLFAHRLPPRCPHSGNDSDISEDCLYLNIWTPRRVDVSLQPVIIILYSETWLKNGVNLPCQELAAEGFVVVTVAYRLHILAFFTLKSIGARGNLALLDQYMSLIWVRENIAAFGGDPNSITLAGHSAGADSVLLHMVSPRSIGLFHRAIIMSPQNIWKAIEKDNDHNNSDIVKLSRGVAQSLGCLSATESEILQCLKIQSLKDIMSQYSNNWTDIIQPIPDNFLPESEQYLPTTLSAALASAKSPIIPVDVIIGTTDLETINYDNNYEEIIKLGGDHLYNQTKSTVIPSLLRLLSLDRPETSTLLSQIIQWEFLGTKIRKDNEQQTVKMIEAIARMETSAKWEAGCALLAARLARRISHLYVYHYSQPFGTDLKGQQFNFTGATHGAELLAVLGDALMLQIARRPTSQNEKEIFNKFRKYIKNFVTYGSPGTQKEWPRYMVGDSYIHEVCNADFTDYNQYKLIRRISFWLQYLPRLSNKLSFNEQAEKITIGNDGNRLRGGVIALCGVSVMFLLLLGVSVVILHKWRTRRPLDFDSQVAN
ncbi:carboxylesterase 4A-like isoform X1 [Nymphalis io]|uniref:carboxylesterase 4A-like isoform X1 n=1 Tax=Inachis io TaxID=171585 RepID=UPI002168145E|nr:carboxylesterase 4A-like isoform X1 [Nymphalis io]